MSGPRTTMLATLVGLALAACGQEQTAAPPVAHEVPADATTYFNGMIVVYHAGPKGQVWLVGDADRPLWFSSTRDTIAFTMLPGERQDIAAIYVHDMARATNWDAPEQGTWIEARRAWYVVGSSKRGGMGAPEPVPLGDKAAAERFAQEFGGTVVAFDAVPESYILGEVDVGAHLAPAIVQDLDRIGNAEAWQDTAPHDHSQHDDSYEFTN